ncbi:MAG TPA: hypothetical protein VFL86_01590 [Burkholderiaceae bacterium]|nr:hypothetical protein [Burkholderiaceae bacterium]
MAQGARSVGVFYQDDGFGQAVLSGTEKALKKRNAQIAARGTFQRNTVVMVGPYAPLAVFIKEARAAGLKSQLAAVSFVGTDNLVGEVGKDGDGVVISQGGRSRRTTTCRSSANAAMRWPRTAARCGASSI